MACLQELRGTFVPSGQGRGFRCVRLRSVERLPAQDVESMSLAASELFEPLLAVAAVIHVSADHRSLGWIELLVQPSQEILRTWAGC